jgi:hypothetical protein
VVSCANTGIASENTIMPVKSSVRSFFILGLDLLKDYFLFPWEQAGCQIAMITQITSKLLKLSKLFYEQTIVRALLPGLTYVFCAPSRMARAPNGAKSAAGGSASPLCGRASPFLAITRLSFSSMLALA